LDEKGLFVDVPEDLRMLFAQGGALFGKEKISGVVQVPLFATYVELDLSVILCSDVVLPTVVGNEFAKSSKHVNTLGNGEGEVGLAGLIAEKW
jgi:hypothetical protein